MAGTLAKSPNPEAVPLFAKLSVTRDPLMAFILSFARLFMLAGFTSEHMLAKAELFPARIRALAVGLPYALTTAILGGSTEFVALKFKAIGHEQYFYWYVFAWAAISVVVYLFMPKTNGRSVRKRQASSESPLWHRTRYEMLGS
jgi:MFS transporter, MHS family, alpha-ketoglutarate permease